MTVSNVEVLVNQGGTHGFVTLWRVACKKISVNLHQFIDTLATQMDLWLRFRGL